MAMQGLEDAPDAAAHGDNAARGESIFEAGKIGREDIRSQHCRMLLTQYMLLCQYLLHPLPLLHSCLNSAFRKFNIKLLKYKIIDSVLECILERNFLMYLETCNHFWCFVAKKKKQKYFMDDSQQSILLFKLNCQHYLLLINRSNKVREARAAEARLAAQATRMRGPEPAARDRRLADLL
ncbi:Protein of unknown function [Gryllus bimaculatus]|nr:Protein of unknown function [Gryllus bimaculatus]